MMRSYNKHLLQQLLTHDHKKSLEDLFQHAHLKLQQFRVLKITDQQQQLYHHHFTPYCWSISNTVMILHHKSQFYQYMSCQGTLHYQE